MRYLLLFVLCAPLLAAEGKPLTVVYENPDFQLTGVTVSKAGRLFVNFPRWSDKYRDAVLEVKSDGSTRPYPDETWNRWDKKPETAGKQFVCVQSVVADDQDALWVLDPAAPMMTSVVKGGAKLVRIDLATDKVTRVYPFDESVAKPNSYLNDIRIDNARKVAYMTDSGAGGIVVLDLASGKARRVLDGHYSVLPDKAVRIVIQGRPVLGAGGKTPQIASDGIALSRAGDWLYYQALTGATLFRIRTSVLRDETASADAVARAVEKVADTFPVDGLWMDAQDRIYLSNLGDNAVSRWSNGQMEKIASDSRLAWPDTFAQGPDGAIYVTASHIHETAPYNGGKEIRTRPYAVFRFKP
jgi:sugar lactone lactonase YvrE